MRVLVLLGAPGAGKGTQADILARHLGLPRVATGDLFRAAVRDGASLGMEAKAYMERGALVPDEVTVAMLLERLAAPDAASARAMVDRAESTLGVEDNCTFCSIMLAVPATMACAAVGDLENAHRHLAIAEQSADLWAGTAWEA